LTLSNVPRKMTRVQGDAIESAGIGPRVRAARERLGWTREALAFHSGLSWSAVAQVESGRRTNVRPSTLAALARPLGVSIDYLIDGGLSRPTMLEHSVFTYDTDRQFQTTMGTFLGEGIERSDAILAVTTTPNIELLREHLGKDARSVEFVDASGWYSSPIAALEAYRAFTDAKLEHGAAWVRVIGEPIWAGRSDAEVRDWTRYESLLNLVFAGSPMTVACPYDERSVAAEIVKQAHLTHPHTVGDAGVSNSPDYTDPGRFALES
jgi:transcriptional regulator with XRE-family HTH domain